MQRTEKIGKARREALKAEFGRCKRHLRNGLFFSRFVKLVFLGRPAQCRSRGCPFGNNAGDLVEVSGSNLALMTRRGIAVPFALEFPLLKIRVRAHSARIEIPGEFKHAVVEGVETGQRNELEFITHLPRAPHGTVQSPGRLVSFFQLNDGEQL